MRKLFGMKSDKDELYFQLEKSLESVKIIESIEYEIFGEESDYYFASAFQSGVPDKESYFSMEKNNIFISAVISKERIHIIIKGKVDQERINKLVSEKFAF